MERLYRKLEEYSRADYYPFHMPGHKRNRASSADDFLFERDITEISGFDNLHHAEGILKEAQEYAAQPLPSISSFMSAFICSINLSTSVASRSRRVIRISG